MARLPVETRTDPGDRYAASTFVALHDGRVEVWITQWAPAGGQPYRWLTRCIHVAHHAFGALAPVGALRAAAGAARADAGRAARSHAAHLSASWPADG